MEITLRFATTVSRYLLRTTL